MNLHLIKEWGVQIFLALDQLANVLPPPIDGTVGYADETLSSHAYRMWRDEKPWGILCHVIDMLFFWQSQHCFDSYVSETKRYQLPPEFRGSNADY